MHLLTFYAGIKVELRSEGCDDPKLVQVHCGRAYIKVNGRDYARKRRGHNLVILDLQTGRNGILSLVSFSIIGERIFQQAIACIIK